MPRNKDIIVGDSAPMNNGQNAERLMHENYTQPLNEA